MTEERYEVATAGEAESAKPLVEEGWEYVCEVGGKALFRRRIRTEREEYPLMLPRKTD